MAPFPVLPYYSTFIHNHHATAQRIWGIAMLEFSLYTVIAVLWLAVESSLSAQSGLDPLPVLHYAMLVSLQCEVWKTLEKMCAMTVLYESCFDMSFGYMVFVVDVKSMGHGVCHRGFPTILTWLRCPLLQFMSVSWTCAPNADKEPIGACIISASQVLLVPLDFTLCPII